MEEPRGFLVGLIIGGGIGALLGVLFAPESGEVTRERVRDQGQRVTGRVCEQANRVADEVRSAAQNVVGEVREFATREQGAAEKMVHWARTTLEEEPTP
jgi:gas vesicle protein